jgi:N-acetylglucosamine kinase-like BadF-type ATPase
VFGLLGLRPGDEVNQLEGWAAQLREPRTAIASLAEVALNLAGQGDVTARAIVDNAADELAQHVRTLEMRLAGQAIDWSFAGGLFASAPLRLAVIDRVGRPPTEPRLPPVGGALLAAARHIGWRTDDGFVAELASSIKTVPARSPAAAEMLARAAQ